MIITDVRKCGEGAEVLVDNKWYFVELGTSKEGINQIINKEETINEEESPLFDDLKKLIGEEL